MDIGYEVITGFYRHTQLSMGDFEHLMLLPDS